MMLIKKNISEIRTHSLNMIMAIMKKMYGMVYADRGKYIQMTHCATVLMGRGRICRDT